MSAQAIALPTLADGQNARLLTSDEEATLDALYPSMPAAEGGRAILFRIPAGGFKVEGFTLADRTDMGGGSVYDVDGRLFDSHGWQLCRFCFQLAGSPLCFKVCGPLGLDRVLVEAYNRRCVERGGEW